MIDGYLLFPLPKAMEDAKVVKTVEGEIKLTPVVFVKSANKLQREFSVQEK